jgi:hypothetical protein
MTTIMMLKLNACSGVRSQVIMDWETNSPGIMGWRIPAVATDCEADIINVCRIRYPDIIGRRQQKGWEDEGSGYIPQS